MRAVLLVCIWLLAGPALADPRITFEGVLADDDGVLVEDTVNLTFALYGAPEGGEALWSETHLGVEVVAGDFFATLGNIEPFGAVLATDAALWLGLSVDGAPEMAPRNPITEVPRAAAALWAADVTGRDIHPRSVSVGDTPVIDAQGNWVGPGGMGGGGAADYQYRFASISAHRDTVCGLLHDGRPLCWGGQNNAPVPRVNSVFQIPDGDFTSVDAGVGVACGILADQSVRCWPNLAAAPAERFNQVSVSLGHACGLDVDARLWCWGNGDALNAPQGRFRSVVAGTTWDRDYGCAVREADGTIACWGNQPEYPRDGGYVEVVGKNGILCGRRADGTISCPQRGMHAGQYSMLTVGILNHGQGSSFRCGIRTDGELVCWGDDWQGQSARSGRGLRTLAAGVDFICGLRLDDTVTCWGRASASALQIPQKFEP